jgi:hypothetical protein
MSWLQDLHNLKKIAVRNVLEESAEYFLERCYRYYSNQYHTPLHTVKKLLTAQEVIVIYYEDKFEDMENQNLIELKDELIEHPIVYSGDMKSLNSQEDMLDDEEWIAKQNDILKKKESEDKLKTEEKNKVIREVADKAIEDMRKKLNLSAVEE